MRVGMCESFANSGLLYQWKACPSLSLLSSSLSSSSPSLAPGKSGFLAAGGTLLVLSETPVSQVGHTWDAWKKWV